MIKHIVLLKFKEHAEGRSKPDNVAMLRRELEKLPGTINIIRSYEVGTNFSAGVDAYDLSILAEFATRQDLDTYINHPDHQRVVAILRGVRESKIVVDYEV